MSHPQNLGSYLWQNGEKIPLEKEKDCITVYIQLPEQLGLIKKIDGVIDIKNVFNGVYRIKVDDLKREFVMNTIRFGFNIVCHHAYKPIHTQSTRYYITEQLTVKFKADTTTAEIDCLLDEYNLHYVRSYGKNTYLLQVTAASQYNPVKITNMLAENECVIYAEPNLISRFSTSFTPSDSKFKEQWHLKSQAGPELAEDADISATLAWNITKGKRSVVIAVLDDGFDLSHPDFKGANKIVHPKDFVAGDNNPLPGPRDFHGTPCAGVAIGEANGEGIVGVAPGCSFMPVRIPFGADTNLLYDIFDYVGQYADVISCSWGPPPVYAPLHQLLYDKIEELAQTGGPRGKGCVIVFAAHNYNAPLKDLTNDKGIEYMAGNRFFRHKDPIWNGNATHPDVIAVSACTSLNKKAAYSNWGKDIDISAPSNNYHPLNRGIRVKGRGICTTDNFKVGQYFAHNSRYTTQFGGTSSAAPVIAGVAGLILSANPNLTAKQVREILTSTTDKIVDTTKDIILGTEKGRYDATGHSEWFGYGKVNAFKAVKKAIEVLPEETTENPPFFNSSLINGHSISTSNGTIPIKIEKVIPSQLANKEAVQLFKLTLGKKLVVRITDAKQKNDFDIYVKKDDYPTKNNFDYRGINEHSNEEIIIEQPEEGDYYIMVESFKGKGDFKLKVSLE